MAAYHILVFLLHRHVLQQKLHTGIVGLNLPEYADILEKKGASRILEIHLLPGYAESLAWRAADKKVNRREVGCTYVRYIAELNGVGEIVYGLHYRMTVNLGRIVAGYLYASLAQSYGSA